MPAEDVIASGQVERIGQTQSQFTMKTPQEKIEQTLQVKDHVTAVQLVIDQLLKQHVIETMTEINGVGHRISNGGDYYQKAVVIDDLVEQRIDEMATLSPLHNPVNLLGIKAFKQILPNTMQVAIFDTAFNSTIPKQNALYAIPYEYYEKYGIRKYGFHGPSHQYITEQVQALFPAKSHKIISCHLGSGASISAIQDGQTLDNSMGFTPLAGLIMGTRSGDIDPQIVPFLEEQEGLSSAEIKAVLNGKSGLLGISGYSNDIRDLEEASARGNQRATLALQMFVHRIQTYIGSYVAELNGVDTIVFTAGIGEHDGLIRSQVMGNFDYLNVKIDEQQNQANALVISQPDSAVTILVIPTDEEIVIARDVYRQLMKWTAPVERNPKMTSQLKRVIQESVPGKQITIAHIIANPEPAILDSIGVNKRRIALGIMTITPPEAAAIVSDIASKAGAVEIEFIDRFSGSLVLSGEVSDVESAMTAGRYFLRDHLGFTIPEITRS